MKVIFERLGSPYLSRRIVRVVYGKSEDTYDVGTLIRAGAAIQSARDSSGYISVYEDEEFLVVETPKYRLYFRPSRGRLISLQEEELWDTVSPVFSFLREKIGYTATLGLIAIHYDGLHRTEKIQQVRSEEVA
jgi:hypothetical protein